MYYDNLIFLLGKKVDVHANGISYRGTLVEVTEMDVFLQSDQGWIQLSLEDVKEINPV